MEAKEQIISEFLSAHNLATARGEILAHESKGIQPRRGISKSTLTTARAWCGGIRRQDLHDFFRIYM
jgi:hypothetical protein